MLLVSIVSLLLTVVAWPVAALIRRRYGASFALSGRDALVYRVVRGIAIVDLAFLAGWMILIQSGLSDLALFDGRADIWFTLLHLLGLLGAIGAAVAIWNAWLAFKGTCRWPSKTWNVVIAAACVAVTWFGFTFNLIEFGVRY